MGVSKTIHKATDSNGASMVRVSGKSTQSRVRINVHNYAVALVQVLLQERTGSGSVVSVWTVRASIDGVTFFALTPSLSIVPGGTSEQLDVACYEWLEVACTTASNYSTDERVNIIVVGASY